MLRALCAAWLVPAASLIWIGLSSTGLRPVSPTWVETVLGRTQALVVVLAALTILVGASAFVRRCEILGPSDGLSWLRSHLGAATVAVTCGLVVSLGDTGATVLLPLAACAGFWAGLALPRLLVRFPNLWAGPLAALSMGIAFQLSIGWLHVLHPSTASPVLIAEGAILAWAAAAAARVDPFAIGAEATSAERATAALTAGARLELQGAPAADRVAAGNP